MWMARDVKSYINTRVASSSAGIAYWIGQINTTRSESTPVPAQIGSEADSGQYPQVYVDLGDSTIPPSKGMDFASLTEDFQMEITAVLRDNSIQKLKNDCENYVEAILRSLEGYLYQPDGTGSFICQANRVQRDDIDTMQNQTRRAVTVTFTVFNNIL